MNTEEKRKKLLEATKNFNNKDVPIDSFVDFIESGDEIFVNTLFNIYSADQNHEAFELVASGWSLHEHICG